MYVIFLFIGKTQKRKMTSYPSLRLVYFPVRARAECARMILAYGNIPYKEDDCNSFFGISFQEAKKAGKLPFGQLPVLEVGGDSGKLLGQSGSINRYLASLVQVRFFQSVFCCICLNLKLYLLFKIRLLFSWVTYIEPIFLSHFYGL